MKITSLIKAFIANVLKKRFSFKLFRFIIAKRIFGTKKRFIYVAIGDSTVQGVGASSPDKSFASLVYYSIKQTFPQTNIII